jgi:hypothetical protein
MADLLLVAERAREGWHPEPITGASRREWK